MTPGSVALETIYQRLEVAECELKRLQDLQETCREAVERLVRTASPTGASGGASSSSSPLGNVEEDVAEVDEGAGTKAKKKAMGASEKRSPPR